MLPPKIGDGVFGSSSGGTNPTGASFSVVFCSAEARVVRSEMGFGDELKSFHGVARVRVVDVLEEEEIRVVGVESDA